MHVAVVVAVAHPVGADAAQAGLPGVDVRVDEPGHHDHPARVDHVRAGGREIAADLDDAVVFDEHVAAVEIAEPRVDGEDRSVPDQCACHGRRMLAAADAPVKPAGVDFAPRRWHLADGIRTRR